jgi:hypothetical protein
VILFTFSTSPPPNVLKLERVSLATSGVQLGELSMLVLPRPDKWLPLKAKKASLNEPVGPVAPRQRYAEAVN